MVILVEKYIPYPPIENVCINENKIVIGKVVLEEHEKETNLVSCEVPGLAEYFSAVSALPREELHTYLAEVQGNNICAECLRRSSPEDLCPPLVQKRRGSARMFYHIGCCDEEEKAQI